MIWQRLRATPPIPSFAHVGEELGRVEQRLGGDAPDIKAGASKRRPPLDAGDAHPKLRGTDGRRIARRATADHDDVEAVAHHLSSIRLGAGRSHHVSCTYFLYPLQNQPLMITIGGWSKWVNARARAERVYSVSHLRIQLRGPPRAAGGPESFRGAHRTITPGTFPAG